ncbi:unnamed protein product [Mytilus edulis]|uniref:CUB domain-containing protein n=1 Tax=Mytilus edulis TaxID=6550 RepID=A0A8S3V060_MYTED|nr:unnamed protein product [Mytilus edulis]
MALGPDWISQSWFLVWIFTLLLSESQTKKTSVYYMKNPECAEFKYLGGATVYSHDKQYTEYYEHMISCRMTFKAENEDWKLVLRFISLDIPDRTDRICNDAVYVFDSDQILRPFDEAGGNFGLCGNEVPTEPMQSSGPFITVHFRTDAKGPRGTGFKFIVTAFSEEKLCCSALVLYSFIETLCFALHYNSSIEYTEKFKVLKLLRGDMERTERLGKTNSLKRKKIELEPCKS